MDLKKKKSLSFFARQFEVTRRNITALLFGSLLHKGLLAAGPHAAERQRADGGDTETRGGAVGRREDLGQPLFGRELPGSRVGRGGCGFDAFDPGG